MTRQAVIEARGLSRHFGSLVAVDGLDLVVERGEVFGFLGPNGAGKSTAIRMLMGLLAPTSGEVEVLGLQMPTQAETLRPRVGYMTQKFSLYEDLSVQENLQFAGEIFGLDRQMLRRRVDVVLDEFGLRDRRDQRPATLSGGWKQRLALAASTVHEPELLLLDEPTAGVDPHSRRLFWEKLFELAERGTTLLVSTHYMDEAVRCHRICVMRDGRRVALGQPEALAETLRGRVVELWAQPMAEVMPILRSQPQVASTTRLGRRVHILLQAEWASATVQAMEALMARLRDAGLQEVGGAVAEANLEDVLVALTQGEDLGGPII